MKFFYLIPILLLFTSCTSLESLGSKGDFDYKKVNIIEVNDLNYKIFTANLFNKNFNLLENNDELKTFSIGDAVSIHIWESGPITLFKSSDQTNGLSKQESSSTEKTTLPVQIIGSNGNIFIPYVGRIKASGLTIQQLESLVYEKIKLKANNPQLFIEGIFYSRSVNILGDVNTPQLYQLKGSEKLIDLLSIAGGLKLESSDYLVSISRKNDFQSISLSSLYKDSSNNIELSPNDVISFHSNPFKATILGASNSNKIVSFGPDNSSLLNIIGKASGINNFRGDLSRVYIFRKTPVNIDYSFGTNVNNWPTINAFDKVDKNSFIKKDYSLISIDLSTKKSLLYSSNFKIYDGDIIVVTNNSIYESQKVLGIIGSIFMPITGVFNAQNIANN